MVMDAELQRIADVYRTESAENLTTMEQALLALERSGRSDSGLVHAVLRAAHTLKGNSATMGFEAVAQAAHQLEDQLERLHDGTLPFTGDLITRFLEAVDGLRRLLRAALDAEPVLARIGEAAPAEPKGPARDATLRVNVARLDTLLDLTAEITIARGRLAQLVVPGETVTESAVATLGQLEQLHGAVQEEVMRLRMVPLGPTLRACHRTVRDIARKQGKQVQLVIEGHDVEVDTSIAEQMRDPLTHMIRNAVDHGIELPADRVSAGKPASGTITLRALHRAGSVVIELVDDGRGLDRARIAAKAEASGLVADARALTDEQLLSLIFEPGFSTAAEVTAVSGRGVGMDIVRRHIRGLRGTIDTTSTPGHGTRFTVQLPLTVAIIDGFRVRAGGQVYVLPLEAVEECLDGQGVRSQPGERAEDGVLNLRGAPVPFARLRDVLGLPGVPGQRESVVVVRHGERRIGLVVDVLEGDCPAVIKPLSGVLQQLPGIAGSTILGDGRVALILDVPQVIGLARAASRARSHQASA
jgi:two-component system, chemotaxis family, sensor kinase CheA